MPSVTSISIAAVERETGLSKDTLRIWERRYAFPHPLRGDAGERCYPPDQVEKLRLLKRLVDAGARPGRVMGLEMDALRDALREMAEERQDRPAMQGRPELLALVALCREHRIDALRAALSQSLMRLGLFGFVADVVGPLGALVGEAWAEGTLAVFEEHLYTEAVQGVLRTAIGALPPAGADARPRVLLTTVPPEEHGLGLLMSEAVMTLEGAHCVPLGVRTPLAEIVRAADAQRIDIVALSFSRSMRTAAVLEALDGLRAALPAHVQLWAGGSAAALRRPPPGILVPGLDGIADALTTWRKAMQPADH
ncbi:MAG TPA: MerR family transcriptional regulator [Noviherbaspirillum sp.]|jgi:DNA-binding transcriptional MerR regulator|uniref:MerR family transcriptional regulator n=1 Tax=Noviherbaspirillum sp. TaxID=1926288 RepID=UPI002F959CDB